MKNAINRAPDVGAKKNKFSKFINLQGKYLTSLLIVLLFGVGQMWGTALADLNFSWPTELPSGYIYSTSNTPTITTISSKSCVYVANGGGTNAPTISGTGITGGKRWMGFTPSVDCTVSIQVYSNKKIFDLYDATGVIASYTNTAQAWEEWTPSVTLKAGKYYAIGARNSQCYVGAMTFSAASVTKHSVTYALNGGTGTTPTQADVAEGAKFTLHDGTTSITAPTGKEFAGWNDGTTTYSGGAEYTMGTSNVTLTAQWQDPAPKYTVTLMPAGGTCESYTGWTYDDVNNKYTKEVSSGTELALPTFTKANRTFKTWRKAGPTDVTSPITVTADVTLTAVWNATVEQVIYSWEGAEGGATETGGTATGSVDGLINVAKSGYYCLQINGNTSYDKYVQITLSGEEKVKTGDKIRYTGFYTNTGTKNAAVKMRASGGTAIFTGANLPRIEEASPRTDTYVVPEGINTASVQITRHQTQTSSFLTKLQIIRPTLVEEANLRTVTFDANGGSAVAAVEVASGSAVAQPANPTWAHHRFNGWKLNSAAYDFSSAVTSNITLVADWIQLYTITYAKGAEDATGDAPTQDELAAGEKFTVAANTFSYEGHDFSKWNDGSADVAPGTEYTMGAANVTLTAQWITATTKVTVTYKDGETTLGSEEITINTGNPVGYATYQTRNLATFDGWYNDPDLAEGHKIADISALTASANVNVYGKWNYQYASSVNIEQWTLDNDKGVSDAQKETQTGALVSLLGTRKFASNIAYDKGNIELDSLNDDPGKTNRNYAYLGLKVKKSGKMLDFRLAKDSYVKIKFGNVAATPKVSINGADYADMELTAGVYSYTATGNDYVSIKTASDGAVVFQQVMINEPIAEVTLPWRVTYDANGGTCATEEAIWSGAALTLPNVTPASEDYTFAGWYDGETLAGAAGASYNAEANVTLQAHFAPVEYAIAYDGNGATSGSMTAGAAGWGTLVTPAVNAFEKTGNIFAGWVITKTSDGSATGITFSEGKFEMPKYDVTLVAQWEDVSKVAVVVETSAKYETLAAAIAAAEAGQTIQLLQNIEQENGVAIAKNLTLDLNGKTYTCTSGSNVNSRAIKITAGNVTIQNGSIIAVPTANFEGGCYGPIRIEGATANVTLEDLTLRNGRHYGLGIKLVEGYLRMEDCTVISENGGGGLEVGEATADVINCTFTQTGLDNAHAWISTCLATCDNGVLNVQGGTYTSEHYSMYVYTSGGEMNVESGSFTGDVVNQVTLSSYPDAVGTINISGGSFEGVGEEPIHFTVDNSGATSIAISGGTFDAPVANEYCAPGYVPATISAGVYGVTPKDGVEIIGVVTTGGTNKTVTGLYKGDASVNLDSNKKLGSNKYIYVTLKDGYTFEESDVLVVDIATKSDIATKALEITTGIGNIDGEVWKTIAFDDYSTGENSISLAGIAANQTSIGLKRSANQNSYINGLKVYRPMKPMLTAITFNGETGAINEANKTVAITLPEATTDLAALTVVPTIVWNAAAAENSIVVNNGAAWQEGANTYKLTDKDGDATTYTITITLQGEAPAPVIATQPAANTAYCAGSEPTLSVTATGDELHYAWYKEAGETDEAVGDDAASYTIASAGTYYVIVTNHVDGKLDKSVTSENAVITLNVAAAITTQPSDLKKQIEGDNITLSVVASNATGYQWYSCEDKDKTNPVLIAGAESANYQFAAAAGFFYCEVTGACGAVESNVAEVTVKRSAGCQYITATSGLEATLADGLKMYAAESDGKQSTSGTSFATASSNAKGIDAGAVGSINKQYILVKFPVDVEEFTIYGYNSSTRSFNNLRVNDHIGTTNNDKFTSDMELTTEEVTKTNSKDGNEITMTAQLTRIIASDEYVWIKFNSALEIFRICYTEALAEPVLPTLGNQELCAGAAYVEMDATITNATACTGTVSYQWYNAANDEAIEGANAATFTPSAEGSYYVVVRHAAAGHVAREVKSANINVAHFDALAISSVSEDVFQHMGTATTLSVVATGKNVAYKWYTCDDAVGNGAVAIDPAQTEASLSIASILEGVHYYKVEVSHDCDATVLSRVIKVEGWNQLEQVDVTASIVWDMTNVSASEINLASFEPSKQNVRLLLANIEGVNNNASFNSQALMFEGQRIGRTENNVKYVSGQYVQFNVTVPGMVSVTFASNGSSQRTIQINGKVCSRTTNDGTYITYNVAVEPGSVEIEDVQGYVRISKIEFKAEDNYHRTVNPSYLGTLCWTNNAVLGGATLYEFAGKNENNYLVFDEVEENRLEAGKPYIFMPENGNTQIKVYNIDDADPLTTDQDPVNNIYGTLTGKTLVPGQDDNMYYFSASHIWAVKDFTVEKITVPAYYCYVDYPAVLAGEPAAAPAPGRRRVTMGVQGEQVATGVEQIADDQLPVKVLINGQLFILRGEKMFNVNGQLVK